MIGAIETRWNALSVKNKEILKKYEIENIINDQQFFLKLYSLYTRSVKNDYRELFDMIREIYKPLDQKGIYAGFDTLIEIKLHEFNTGKKGGSKFKKTCKYNYKKIKKTVKKNKKTVKKNKTKNNKLKNKKNVKSKKYKI
jgi:hypothetical protein